MHRRSTFVAVVPLALFVAGCEGPAGPQGEPGQAGASSDAAAQGPVGATGPQGPTTSMGEGGIAIQTSCLSPCHGFNGVVSQFQSSVHYTEYLANVSSATPETEWTTPGAACGNCHAIDALEGRVGGNVLTTDGGVVTHLASGTLQYRDPVTGALSTANYAGSATVAEVYCTTCHAVTDANDPHKTGVPWQPGIRNRQPDFQQEHNPSGEWKAIHRGCASCFRPQQVHSVGTIERQTAQQAVV